MASLKSYISSLLSAWRGSHKSVMRGDFIAVDLTQAYGFENMANIYTAPCDGVLVIETPSPCTGYLCRYGNLFDIFGRGSINNDGLQSWYVGFIPMRQGVSLYCAIYGTGETGAINLRFYPYVGS